MFLRWHTTLAKPARGNEADGVVVPELVSKADNHHFTFLWLRLFLRLRAVALALRVGLALFTAAACRPCASRAPLTTPAPLRASESGSSRRCRGRSSESRARIRRATDLPASLLAE